jgi:site-specific recombinase XerD
MRVAHKARRRAIGAGRGSGLYSLVDLYVGERVALGEYSIASAGVVRSVLRSLAGSVDGELGALDGPAVRAWLAATAISPATVKSKVTKARPFVRWLVRDGYLDADVMEGIASPRLPKRLPRALPMDAVAKVLVACPDARARLIVLLMVQMGLRVGEIASIDVRDIDGELRVLQVRGKGGRGDVTRAVPFTREVLEALDVYLAEVGVRYSGRLILSYNDPTSGLTAHTMSQYARRWFSLAGVKVHAYDGVSAHALRHTCAQDVVDGGADLRHVQELLGHSSLRTTQEYLRLNPPGLREAMEGRRYGDLELISAPGPPLEHRCPHCGRPFRLPAGLGRHLQTRHRDAAA